MLSVESACCPRYTVSTLYAPALSLAGAMFLCGVRNGTTCTRHGGATQWWARRAAFSGQMRDPVDGLYSHGVNLATGHHSCCKWGRANGWGMLSHVEVLNALSVRSVFPLAPRGPSCLFALPRYDMALPSGQPAPACLPASLLVEHSLEASPKRSMTAGALPCGGALPLLRRALCRISQATR